jgi:hypothetical protein
MSLSPFVLVTLAVCWILPTAFIAVWYGLNRYRTEEAVDAGVPAPREMERTHKSVRARLSAQYGSTSSNQWSVLHAGSYSDVVSSETSSAVRELSLSAPYAEATVQVVGEDGTGVQRRCSICMN